MERAVFLIAFLFLVVTVYQLSVGSVSETATATVPGPEAPPTTSSSSTAMTTVASRAMTKPSTWLMRRGDSELRGRVTAIPSGLRRLWQHETTSTLRAPVVVGRTRIFLVGGKGLVQALDRNSGALQWQYDGTGKGRCTASPLLARVDGRELLIVGTERGRLVAVDAQRGTLVWERSFEDKITGGCIPYRDGSRFSLLVTSHTGYLHCLDANSGKERWRVGAGEAINGSPALSGKVAAFGGCDGKLRLVDCSRQRETHVIELGAHIPSSPALEEDRAYVTVHDGRLVAVDVKQGSMLWSLDEQGSYFASPAVGEDCVVAAETERKLSIVDKETGTLRRRILTSGDSAGEPLVDDERVLMADKDGNIACYSLETGRQLWRLRHGSAILAPLVLCDGRLYVADRDGLTVYGSESK